MKISKITGALALTMAVSALPAMAINTSGRAYDYNYPNQNQRQNQNQNGRFKGMDRNGDGVITRDEWRGNDNSFEKHDRNRDGVISAADRQYAKQGHGKKAKKQHRENDREDD